MVMDRFQNSLSIFLPLVTEYVLFTKHFPASTTLFILFLKLKLSLPVWDLACNMPMLVPVWDRFWCAQYRICYWCCAIIGQNFKSPTGVANIIILVQPPCHMPVWDQLSICQCLCWYEILYWHSYVNNKQSLSVSLSVSWFGARSAEPIEMKLGPKHTRD